MFGLDIVVENYILPTSKIFLEDVTLFNCETRYLL